MLLKRLKNDGVQTLDLNPVQSRAKASVLKKVADQTYDFEKVECPVCETKDSEEIGRKDRYGLYFPTRICRQCGLVYTSPRMNQTAYNQFYNDEYRPLYVGKEMAGQAFFEKQRWKGLGIYHFLEKNNGLPPKGSHILEVGCGAGGILDVFREKGYRVSGLDLGEEYVNYGRDEHGLDLFSGFLADFEPQQAPDLIIYSHVLEHILDIPQELAEIQRVSHSGTLVFFEVPGILNLHKNYRMDLLRYLQNAHTYHFSLTSLKNLLGKHGFECLAGNEFVRGIFRYKEGYISPPFNEFERVKAYLKRMEWARFFYPVTPIAVKSSIKSRFIQMFDRLGLLKSMVELKHRTLRLLRKA